MPNFLDPTSPDQFLFCRLVAGEIPAVRVHGNGTALLD